MEKRKVTKKTIVKASRKTPAKPQVAVKTAEADQVEARKTLSLPHINFKGEKERAVIIPEEIFGKKLHPQLLAQAVRVYQVNKRQGTVSTKTRGEVAGSTRKIYRQKGTGKARHGSIKAPIFVGGGIVFGPKPRDFKLSLPKKMQRQVMVGLIGEKSRAGKISVVSGLASVSGKTKEMALFLHKLNFKHKKLLLVLDAKLTEAIRAARNIKGVTIRQGGSFSALDVLQNEQILFAKEAFESFKKLHV